MERGRDGERKGWREEGMERGSAGTRGEGGSTRLANTLILYMRQDPKFNITFTSCGLNANLIISLEINTS